MNKIQIVEQFKVMFLDHRLACLGIVNLSTGGITSAAVDPRIALGMALKAKATKLMLAHNHPSGALKPSDADIALTENFVRGGKYLNIDVIDHLIVTNRDYYSFADHGRLPYYPL